MKMRIYSSASHFAKPHVIGFRSTVVASRSIYYYKQKSIHHYINEPLNDRVPSVIRLLGNGTILKEQKMKLYSADHPCYGKPEPQFICVNAGDDLF